MNVVLCAVLIVPSAAAAEDPELLRFKHQAVHGTYGKVKKPSTIKPLKAHPSQATAAEAP